MGDTNPTLIGRTLSSVVRMLETDPASAEAWTEARRALGLLRDENPDLAAAVESEDMDALRGIVDAWYAEDHKLPEQDRNLLKRAMKAYRKRLKLTLLDAESAVGGGPMSGGRTSDIVGITPPDHYPREVWDELVVLGRLVDARYGMYELPPGG
jgi:hypothetical protein